MRRVVGLPKAAFWTACLLGGLLAAEAPAEDKGQADLDKATQLKMTATTLADLNEVIRLCESAQDRGLDQTNGQFAKKLLAASLLERGSTLSGVILGGRSLDPSWRQIRKLALADLDRAVQLDPKQSQAWVRIARLNLFPGGDARRAAEAIDRAVAASADLPPVRSEALVLRASIAKGGSARLADLDEAVKLSPKNAAAFRARGLARADDNQPARALDDLDKALELDPQHLPTIAAKALLLANMKKFDEATATIDKARTWAPGCVVPLFRGRIHAMQGDLKAAVADLNEANTLEPGNLDVLLLRASVRYDQGEKDRALADVDRALEYHPNDPKAVRLRAILLIAVKRYDEAMEALETLRRQDPKDLSVLEQLGELSSAKKDYAKAIDLYSTILKDRPKAAAVLGLRAMALIGAGRRAEALADYDKSLALKPKDVTVLNNLAWLLATAPEANLRDGRRAVMLATQACRLTDYKKDFILSTLAAAYAESGDFDNAVKWSSKSVELGAKNKEDGASLKKELASYQAKKPWREANPEPAAAKETKKTEAKPPAAKSEEKKPEGKKP